MYLLGMRAPSWERDRWRLTIAGIPAVSTAVAATNLIDASRAVAAAFETAGVDAAHAKAPAARTSRRTSRSPQILDVLDRQRKR
jgi:hypothetical protein